MNNANSNANHTVDTVDRVLAGLRDSEAPAGMDRRILAALHQRAETKTSAASSSITSPLLWLAATAAAVIAVTLWWSTASHPTHDLATTNTPSTTTPNITAPQPAADLATNRATQHPGHAPHPTAATQSATNTLPATTRETAAPSPLPATLAASHPAPPLPLTQQEQQLLRIVHKGDPIELASINNDFRDRQPLRDAEDFHRFFKPPASPQPTETQPTTGDQPTPQNQPDIEAQPAPEPAANDIPQQ
jgi:hypothetical protein